MKLEYIIKDNDNCKTINEILKQEFHISARLFPTLLKTKSILLNSNVVDTRNIISTGDIITVSFDYGEDNSNVVPTKMDLNIIYEDDAYIILDKPPKVAIHPSCRHYDTSLSNGIRYYFDQIGLKKKIRPVNRLDIDTSGIVMFAKNEYVQQNMIYQMATKQFQKKYICIVSGVLTGNKGTICIPISRKSNSLIEREVSVNGQPAITNYEVLEKGNNISFVQCQLETGRTHQIRVHFSSIGHPILGDTLYGTPSDLIDRQALHSSSISFIHPVNHKLVTYTSPLPSDMKQLKDITF